MSQVEDITNVLVRYATGIDSRDWNLFRTCFTDDCQLDYGALGQWSSRDAVTRFMQMSHSGPSQHRLTNFAITVEGDQARSRTYVDAVVLGPGGWGGVNTIGYYDDELVHTAEGWQIARRRHTGVRMKFLGLLGLVPAGLAMRLAVVGARRLNAAATAA
ncbi:nuclear transport factor 2 family protein [Sinimarinibacterium flocculans]|uniref:SnoaL-like protein n=1 Tax=Sinimarinibacterium flocculans TaxID=985250 RepID=A0A318EA70_9GAMM|nr:nuclear transport factor 2 family protein [Sinimarinibacterium flocculans]PXV66438.1 SnoaL-like protein [Sinimarinibacterium flocculans]